MGFGIVPKSIMLDGTLSAQAKALYALIATFADRAGNAHLSRELMAEALGKSTRMISTYCQELEERGYLVRTIQEGAATIYHLTLHANTLETYFKGKRGETLEADRKGTPETGRKGAKDFKGTPETHSKGTLETGFPHNKTSKKEEDRERGACAREGASTVPDADPRPNEEIPGGWSAETVPVLNAWLEWKGRDTLTPAIERTLRLLLQPRGSPVGARIPGAPKLYHGFTPEQVIAGIEDLAMRSHHSPTSLIKHVAGEMPEQGRRHGRTDNNPSDDSGNLSPADELRRRVTRRGGTLS